HVGHDPVVVAYRGLAPVLRGAEVEGAELADGVAAADHEARGLARVFLVLRYAAQGSELENRAVVAYRRVPFDHAMRAHAGARAYGDLRPYDRIGADRGARIEPRLRVNQGRGM